MARANALFVYAVGFRRGLQARMYVSLMPPPSHTCTSFSSYFNGELLIRCNKRDPYAKDQNELHIYNQQINN